ncbi:MAG: M15 family metallopeptidase [Rikenellaceae bacterium]
MITQYFISILVGACSLFGITTSDIEQKMIDYGNELDMGSSFDYFGAAAHVGNEQMLVKNGEMTEQAHKNRMLLTTIMKSVGFVQHPKEWWHFHKYTMTELKSNFKLLNF